MLVAFSGGKDSAVLLDILQRLAPRWNLRIHAYHLNHQLRGSESDSQEEFVKRFCEELGIPVMIERADIRRIARTRHISAEMAGREVRYKRLKIAAGKVRADKIVTAHTLSDQLETFLLRLVMGTDLQGLTGIPVKSGPIVRPLLCVWTSEIIDYTKEWNIQYFHDTSNDDLAIPRNYIRHRVVPSLINAMDGRILKTFPRTLKRLTDERTLTQQIEDLMSQTARRSSLKWSELANLPDALARFTLHSFLTAHINAHLSDKVIDSILEAVKSGKHPRRWHLTSTRELSLSKGLLRVQMRKG